MTDMRAEMIREELEAYRDPFGLIQNTKGGVCGNGLCFSGEAAIQLHKKGLVNDRDRERWRNAVEACFHPERDCLRRHPTADRAQNGPDDYHGFAVGCLVYGTPDLARRVVEYGKRHFYKVKGKVLIPFPFFDYYMRDEDPYVTNDLRAMLGRQRGLIGLLNLAAYGKMTWIQKKICEWNITHVDQSKPGPFEDGGQDAWRLSLITAYCLKYYNQSSDAATREFDRLLAVSYPQGIGQCYLRYFAHPHWLAKYSEPGVILDVKNYIAG